MRERGVREAQIRPNGFAVFLGMWRTAELEGERSEEQVLGPPMTVCIANLRRQAGGCDFVFVPSQSHGKPMLQTIREGGPDGGPDAGT